MKRTRYDEIAEKYHEDRRHRDIGPADLVKERLEEASTPVAVLDVGCGTGIWLAAQTRHFAGRSVRWVGVDPSGGMLAVAKRALPGVELIQGRAERLPFPAESFDVVVSITAFHHFEDKPAAVSEMARVLKPGGTIRIANIEPWSMRRCWIYTRFPETWEGDQERFWPVERMVAEFARHGFTCAIDIAKSTATHRLSDHLAEAERRTTSQLDVLDDAAYERGLATLRADVSANPERGLESEGAFLTLTARRP
ncbi:MAG: class I SAM-dependent methyltransferase [Candidatus Coatesbacteria bacterium]|mgnify:CR=1 FL=1